MIIRTVLYKAQFIINYIIFVEKEEGGYAWTLHWQSVCFCRVGLWKRIESDTLRKIMYFYNALCRYLECKFLLRRIVQCFNNVLLNYEPEFSRENFGCRVRSNADERSMIVLPSDNIRRDGCGDHWRAAAHASHPHLFTRRDVPCSGNYEHELPCSWRRP